MTDTFAALLSWAVLLSGFPSAPTDPIITPVTHTHLVQRACDGRECQIFALYKDGVIYVDARLQPETDLYHASVMVHEMVHHLQDAAGATARDCAEHVQLERQAYAVQREFLHRYGVYQPVGFSFHTVECAHEG